MSDQHHAGIMGCAGDPNVQTPALDRLAAGGARFTNAYCSFPLCGPSRMSFLTARHPHQIGIWDNQAQLSSDIPTFAHAFLAAGYDTILSGRMHFVGGDQRHGFARRLIGDVTPNAHLAAGWQLEEVLGSLIDTPGMSRAGLIKSGPGRTGYQAYDEAVTRVTVEWLRERGRRPADSPFLLTVGYVLPHCPFVAQPDDFAFYRSRIAPADLPAPDPHLHPLLASQRRRFQLDPAPPGDAQWRARVAYYGLCSFLDRQVDQVLHALDKARLADNTIIVYCSDHGEMLGEHGLWWKSTFYDGASRVPLLITAPGRVPAGQVRTRNVSLMDIGPTLLDMTGADPLPGVTGRSFRSLLEGDRPGWPDTVFAEYLGGGPLACRMVRSGPWKYNYYHGQPAELFHLIDDPGETRNLCGLPIHQAIQAKLHALALQDWDPERIARQAARWPAEQRLIAHWIQAAQPAQPDPPWFASPPENRIAED